MNIKSFNHAQWLNNIKNNIYLFSVHFQDMLVKTHSSDVFFNCMTDCLCQVIWFHVFYSFMPLYIIHISNVIIMSACNVMCILTCFMPNHWFLLCVFENSNQCGYGLFVLHLSQAVGQLVLQEGRLINEGLADPLYSFSPWHKSQLTSVDTYSLCLKCLFCWTNDLFSF